MLVQGTIHHTTHGHRIDSPSQGQEATQFLGLVYGCVELYLKNPVTSAVTSNKKQKTPLSCE
jgi:hypothetical protein